MKNSFLFLRLVESTSKLIYLNIYNFNFVYLFCDTYATLTIPPGLAGMVHVYWEMSWIAPELFSKGVLSNTMKERNCRQKFLIRIILNLLNNVFGTVVQTYNVIQNNGYVNVNCRRTTGWAIIIFFKVWFK